MEFTESEHAEEFYGVLAEDDPCLVAQLWLGGQLNGRKLKAATRRCCARGRGHDPALRSDGNVGMSTRKRAVDHSFKHGDERIGGKRVMNIGQALLPALRLQQRQ